MANPQLLSMIFLALSVLLSSYLTLSFKVLQKLNIPVFPSIVFNYVTCVVTGSLFNQKLPVSSGTLNEPWLVYALLLGSLFIGLFNIIAFTAQNIGIAVASVANKLSLVIPALFFIIVKGESASWLKITGLVLATISVLFTCYVQNKNTTTTNISPILYWLLPLILFLGSGSLDTVFKLAESKHLTSTESMNSFLVICFGVSAVVGLLVLMYQYIFGKAIFSIKTLLAGICIGVPNYFSIYFLGKTYQAKLMDSSAIIPVNNLLIVLVSTMAAAWFFKEKLSKVNWLGILIAIIAISLIVYSNQP
jgi:drug/metabolite transporter (DMT)-like permease